MDIPDELKRAVELVYNHCKEVIDFRNEEEVDKYISDIKYLKNKLEKSVGDMDEDNVFHRNICREIQQECPRFLPGCRNKQKIVTYTTHFLQDIKLFYKELEVDAYCGIYDKYIQSNEKIDINIITSMNESRRELLILYNSIYPNDDSKDKDKLIYLTKNIHSLGGGFALKRATKKYEKDYQMIVDYRNKIDSLKKEVISEFKNEQVKPELQIISVLSQHLSDKFDRIKFDEGHKKSIDFICRVMEYLDIIVFLRKLDLMCSQKQHYDPTLFRPTSSRAGSVNSATSHKNFIYILMTLKVLCVYYMVQNN